MDAITLETVAVLESHIDHLTGEELGHAFTMLQQAGALDVIWLPGIMKKNRPGGVFRAICMPDDLESVQEAFFRHTHTLGIRRSFVERAVLARRAEQVATPYGPQDGPLAGTMAAKSYTVDGKTYIRTEFEALARAAADLGVGIPALRFAGTAEDKDEEKG